jgi:hypothetical protein
MDLTAIDHLTSARSGEKEEDSHCDTYTEKKNKQGRDY